MYGRVAIYLCIHVWSAHRNLENIVNALRSFAPLIALYHKKKVHYFPAETYFDLL